MKKEHIALILSFVILSVGLCLTTAAAGPTIKDIRFETPSSNEDRIIFELNGAYIPTTGKALPGKNPRIYFDFPEAAPAGKIKNRISTNGNFVKQIRHAYHKGPKPKTRVVFDLTTNAKIKFSQNFDPATNTLVISLYPSGAKPEPVTFAPQPTPKAAPEPSAKKPPAAETPKAITEEPSMPKKAPAESAAKASPSMTDAGIAREPEPPAKMEVQETPPPPPPPEPEKIAPPEKQPPPPQAKPPQVASLPPSPAKHERRTGPAEEATVIQPMSEVGAPKIDESQDVAPVLYSVEYDPKSSRGEMISFRLNGFHPPVVFGIEEDMPRIVCFFKNATAGPELRDIIGTNGKYVKNIRVGKYENPDNIRVVLELVPGNNYDLQQVFFKEDKMFMLIINKAGKQMSSQGN